MSMLSTIRKGKQANARRTVCYGVHGIGKSTFASEWPEPIFVPTEDGCGDLDVHSFPLCETLEQAWQAIIELGQEGAHEYKTVVLDSADWLEKLIWRSVCEKHDKKAITEFDYGKGYGFATEIFRRVLGALDACRSIGMHVVVLAHCDIVKFTEPGLETYDRYAPKLHRDASSVLQEWADEVLFAGYKRFVRKEELGFKRTRGIAVGDDRVLYTCETPGHLAKNRLGLPPEMPLSFEEYSKFLS